MPTVNCKGMSFEKSMRLFRRKVERAGIKDRMRELETYTKPSVAKNDRNNYRKRQRKLEAHKAWEHERMRRTTRRR